MYAYKNWLKSSHRFERKDGDMYVSAWGKKRKWKLYYHIIISKKLKSNKNVCRKYQLLGI